MGNFLASHLVFLHVKHKGTVGSSKENVENASHSCKSLKKNHCFAWFVESLFNVNKVFSHIRNLVLYSKKEIAIGGFNS
jgi:hypothetical protein